MTAPSRGLLDTSVLIATETGRPLDTNALPDEVFISVVTIAELQAGVLEASDTATRARRLAALDSVAGLEALPIDVIGASHWATLRVRFASETAPSRSAGPCELVQVRDIAPNEQIR